MHKTFAAAALAALLTIPAAAQTAAQTQVQTPPTAAELLQKGIYAQEISGDVEGAIKIYRQIAESHPSQREIGAQAQYRLGMTLLAKGDAATASQEIQRLGWDYPDYKDLIDSAKKGTNPSRDFIYNVANANAKWNAAAAAGEITVPLHFYTYSDAGVTDQLQITDAAAEDLAKRLRLEANNDAAYDFSKSVTVTGAVTQVEWPLPSEFITVQPASIKGPMPTGNVTSLPPIPPIRVSIEGVSGRMRGGAGSMGPGDQVTIIGAPARDGTMTLQATRITLADGTLKYLRTAPAAK